LFYKKNGKTKFCKKNNTGYRLFWNFNLLKMFLHLSREGNEKNNFKKIDSEKKKKQ